MTRRNFYLVCSAWGAWVGYYGGSSRFPARRLTAGPHVAARVHCVFVMCCPKGATSQMAGKSPVGLHASKLRSERSD